MSLDMINTPLNEMHQIPQDSLQAHCKPITLRAFLPYVLVIIQCALLHPTFVNSKLARSIRVGLAPVNFIWCFMLPFRYCSTPLETSGQANLGLGSFAIYMAAKSLEWGFVSGPYYKRPLKTIEGIQRWEKVELADDRDRQLQEAEPCDGLDLLAWTVLQITSMRGLQFTWGPAAVASENRSILDLVKELIRLNIPLSCTLFFIVLTRDSPLHTPTSAIMSLGVPDFPGLKFLAESLYTFAFGVWLGCDMEKNFTLLKLYSTLVFKLTTWLRCRGSVIELFNPLYFPPIFNSPHKSSSIAELWGRSWQRYLQRIFLITGGKPAVWMTRQIGASQNIQKLGGLFGTFAASAFYHEYLMFFVTRRLSFPGSALYFMLQPFAILVEPLIIPLIPKRLGGSRLWVWMFSILAAYTFRTQWLFEGRVVSHLPALSQWSWLYILSPLKT